MTDPGSELAKIADKLGLGFEIPEFTSGKLATWKPQHTLTGDPPAEPYHYGEEPLFLDDSWKESTGWLTKLVVTALTAPLLLRYKYSLGGRGRRIA